MRPTSISHVSWHSDLNHKPCVHENNVLLLRHRSKVSATLPSVNYYGGPRRFQPRRVKTVYLCVYYSQLKLMGMKFRFCRH